MILHTTGAGGLALFVEDRGPGDLNSAEAEFLAREAIRSLGLDVKPREISAFTGRGGLFMVVKWDAPAEPAYFFRAEDADALLDMLRVSEGYPRRAWASEGQYILGMAESACSEGLADALSEFGERLYRDADFALFLDEHENFS